MRKLVRHDNIVELFGSVLVPDDLAGKKLFLAMEACDANLRKLCHPKFREEQLSELDIDLVIWKILNGLKFMHDLNIMHR